MKPNFLGIGAQKCASTWVYRLLEEHPQTWMSSPKELDFFSYHYNFGFKWYEDHFAGGEESRIAGEISPSYLCDWEAARRAHEYNPSFRLVVTLRDPVERMYSNHLHEIRLGHIPPELTFEEGLDNNPMYLEQSRYGHHLSRWFELFPEEQILVIFQEDVAAAAEVQATRLMDFLGLEAVSGLKTVHRRSNRSEVARYAGIESALKQGGAFLRKQGMGGLVDRVRALTPVESWREKSRLPLHASVPPVLPETRIRLVEELSEDGQKLEALLHGRQIPWRQMSADEVTENADA